MTTISEIFQSVPGVKRDWANDWVEQDVGAVKIDWDNNPSNDLPLFFGFPFTWRNSRVWDNENTWAN